MTVALHHVLTGPEDAPVLVLSNSLGTTHAMWDRQAGPLTEWFRLLRYDTRGHGGSPVVSGPYAIADLGRDVLDLLDSLRIDHASFCGLSLGGMTGMWLAAHAPERIDRLVLSSTTAYFPPREQWEERAALVRAQGTQAVAEGAIERWLTPEFAREDPDMAASLVAMIGSVSDEAYAACCEAIAGMDLREDLHAIRAPTLVIVGADDPSTPPDHAHRLVDAIAGSHLLEVPHARHLLNIEQAVLFTGAVVEHLEAGERAEAEEAQA